MKIIDQNRITTIILALQTDLKVSPSPALYHPHTCDQQEEHQEETRPSTYRHCYDYYDGTTCTSWELMKEWLWDEPRKSLLK